MGCEEVLWGETEQEKVKEIGTLTYTYTFAEIRQQKGMLDKFVVQIRSFALWEKTCGLGR